MSEPESNGVVVRTTYLLLDTNILYRYVTQGHEGYEPDLWGDVIRLVDAGRLRLLLSEVVTLEFQKLCRHLDDDIAGNIGAEVDRARNSFNIKPRVWNELGNFPKYIDDCIKTFAHGAKQQFQARAEMANRALARISAIHLPLDPDLMLRAERRKLSHRTDLNKERNGADLLILESLARYFDGPARDDELLFCTDNRKDFGTEVRGDYLVHSAFRGELPGRTRFFANLHDLVQFVRGDSPLESPRAEDVEEARKREAKLAEIDTRLATYEAEMLGELWARHEPQIIHDAEQASRMLDEEGREAVLGDNRRGASRFIAGEVRRLVEEERARLWKEKDVYMQ